jgi:hypothetical protein
MKYAWLCFNLIAFCVCLIGMLVGLVLADQFDWQLWAMVVGLGSLFNIAAAGGFR